MRDNLDFSTRISHHEDTEAYLDVSITNYQEGARVSILTCDKQRVTLNREELLRITAILNAYEQAETIMEGAVEQ